ncbi:YggS family pyridoxal phosphate-dependent enzyme [Flavobacteriaceae bacterium R38]|nr:YggS family pyridoxal phosphate-dependent enzyme [Flavobacteriaceae bacterium R38]
MSIAQNLLELKKSIPDHVTLVAVSKTKPISDISEAYQSGQRVFGENKIQEMTDKQAALPEDIKWHMIGHVQTNKVKYMASYVDCIHGVDSLKLLKEINKQALKHQRVIHCLLQIRIAEEDTKFGMTEEQASSLLSSSELQVLNNIKIVGFMGMASFTENKEQIKNEFSILNKFFENTKKAEAQNSNIQLETLSMGMSGDYQIAIASGSNMVRIGSSIFGARNYQK